MNAIGLLLLALLVSNVQALDMKALDALSSEQLDAIQQDRFSGSFRDSSRSLRLYTYDQLNYEGEILFKGELYLLKAVRAGERLRGHINRSGQRFDFEIYFQEGRLVFQTKQGQFSLQPSVPRVEQRPYPDTNPPVLDYTPKQTLQQSSHDWEASINYLAPQVSQDLHEFVKLLRQWFTGKLEDAEATSLVKLRLLPLSVLLAENLSKLEKVAKAEQKQEIAVDKLHQWQHLEKISAHSQQFFTQWQGLLQQMLYLNQQGKQDKLKTLANERLPIAIKNTQIVIQRLYTVLLELQQDNAPPLVGPPVPAHYLHPDKLLKMENMRGMAEMMREAMRLFREMFFPDSD